MIVILPARIKSQKWVCPHRMHPSPGPCTRPWPVPSRHFIRAIANHSKGITQRCNRLYEGGTVNLLFQGKIAGEFHLGGGESKGGLMRFQILWPLPQRPAGGTPIPPRLSCPQILFSPRASDLTYFGKTDLHGLLFGKKYTQFTAEVQIVYRLPQRRIV